MIFKYAHIFKATILITLILAEQKPTVAIIDFDSYGITKGNIDDPNKKNIMYLANEVHQLNQKIVELTKELEFIQSKEEELKVVSNKDLTSRKPK